MKDFLFKIKDTVYFTTDKTNEPWLVVGLLDRGDCIRYLIGSYQGERECAGYEISTEKSYT